MLLFPSRADLLRLSLVFYGSFRDRYSVLRSFEMSTVRSIEKVQPVITLITNADQEAARKIKMLLPYGAKLTDDNALALAAYSRLHGLDPFNGECYFLVREKFDDRGVLVKREELGVYPGIRGKRKVAKQQLAGFDPQATYKIDYLVVGPDAVGLKSAADEIALVVEAQLRDTVSTSAYLAEFYKLQGMKADGDLIRAVLGKPPVWTGFGVVKSSELRYIKMSPMALAKKRAESDATNQRFDLPFADDALADDLAPDLIAELENGITNDGDPVVVEGIIASSLGVPAEFLADQPTSKMTMAQAVSDLGFGPAPAPAPVDIEEPGDFVPAEPEEPAIDDVPVGVLGEKGQTAIDGMTLGDAKAQAGPDGVCYGDLSKDQLVERFSEISRFVKRGATPRQLVTSERRLQAIRLILASEKASYLLQTKS